MVPWNWIRYPFITTITICCADVIVTKLSLICRFGGQWMAVAGVLGLLLLKDLYLQQGCAPQYILNMCVVVVVVQQFILIIKRAAWDALNVIINGCSASASACSNCNSNNNCNFLPTTGPPSRPPPFLSLSLSHCASKLSSSSLYLARNHCESCANRMWILIKLLQVAPIWALYRRYCSGRAPNATR